MNIIRGEREELDRKAAKIIAESIASVLLIKDKVNLAVPGGRSVSGIFSELRKLDIPWEHVHVFMVDERLVPLDHEDSNFRLAKQTFLADLLKAGELKEKNLHPFIYEGDVERAIKEYDKDLDEQGGVFDVVLLSSGEDGHVGALFPNHHSLKDSSSRFISMTDSPKPPKDRVSASRKLLQRSEMLILLFYGESKREAFERYRDGDVSVWECPAKIALRVQNAYVLTDLK